MSLRIRLSRGGAKKRPYYRIVVADSRSPRDGRFIERLGAYNPVLPSDHKDRVILKEERIRHWLGLGALPSTRVHRFLAKAGILDALPIPEQTKQDKPKAKGRGKAKRGHKRLGIVKQFSKQGELIATYETLEIPEGETMCFTYLTGSGEATYHLQSGEYGVKPSE